MIGMMKMAKKFNDLSYTDRLKYVGSGFEKTDADGYPILDGVRLSPQEAKVIRSRAMLASAPGAILGGGLVLHARGDKNDNARAAQIMAGMTGMVGGRYLGGKWGASKVRKMRSKKQ